MSEAPTRDALAAIHRELLKLEPECQAMIGRRMNRLPHWKEEVESTGSHAADEAIARYKELYDQYRLSIELRARAERYAIFVTLLAVILLAAFVMSVAVLYMGWK